MGITDDILYSIIPGKKVNSDVNISNIGKNVTGNINVSGNAINTISNNISSGISSQFNNLENKAKMIDMNRNILMSMANKNSEENFNNISSVYDKMVENARNKTQKILNSMINNKNPLINQLNNAVEIASSNSNNDGVLQQLQNKANEIANRVSKPISKNDIINGAKNFLGVNSLSNKINTTSDKVANSLSNKINTTSDKVAKDALNTRAGFNSFISKTVNIYSAYNPYRVDENEEPFIKGFPMIFITTPFLNLEGNVNYSTFLSELKSNDSNIYNSLSYGLTNSPFIKILSNRFKEVSLKDLSTRSKEMYETFYGMKQMMPGSYVDSVTGDDLSIKYIETKNLAITKTHKAWSDYIENIRRGLFQCNQQAQANNFMDFTSSLYYFLLDFDMETILFYSKYTGLTPVGVPFSSFSNEITGRDLVELDINYIYSFKEDLDPVILMDFNTVSQNTSAVASGGTGSSNPISSDNSPSKYVDIYEKSSDGSDDGVSFSTVKVVKTSLSSYDSSDCHIGKSYNANKGFVYKLKFS